MRDVSYKDNDLDQPTMTDRTSNKGARLTVSADETVYCNTRYLDAKPILSVGSPYFHDDPTAWVTALAGDPRAENVEIVLVDDGTGNAALDTAVRAAVDAWPGPAIVVRFHTNKGRSQARNRAITATRRDYVLFIDSDMLPGDQLYLKRYFDVMDKKAAAIVYGGFTSSKANLDRETVLSYSLAQINDCKPASERSLRGPLSVASNNLLVRRDVFDFERFDDGFVGWSWEDTEWAMRAVYAGYGLAHIDNPAVHVGLETTKSMLRKYREAGRNLHYLLNRHPEGAQMSGATLAQILTKFSGQALLQPLASWLVMDTLGIIPMGIRRLAAKVWRASHAAQALKALSTATQRP